MDDERDDLAGETGTPEGSAGDAAPSARGKRPKPASAGRASARDVVAAHLAAGRTIRAAAKAGNVGERTARRWCSDPDFRAVVDALRAEMVKAALGSLTASMRPAAAALKKLIANPDANVRLRAARAAIELGLKLREHLELEERVRELEAKLGEGKV